MHLQAAGALDTEKPPISALLQQARRHADSGNTVEGERCYRSALLTKPDHPEALYRLAMLVQLDPQRSAEALDLLDLAIAKMSCNPALHAARAQVLNKMSLPLEALDAIANAVFLAPRNTDFQYNLGLLYAELCCPAQAEIIAQRLLTQHPDWPAAHYLLLRARTGIGADAEEIEARYASLIKSDPLNVSLRFARGLHQLATGDYQAGWEAQEWRWEIEPVKSARPVCTAPRWAGGPLEGRRLLILGEQGFGDILQFARYLPLLIARGARVTLQLDENRAALSRLLGRIAGLQVVIGSTPQPPCDLVCPLASLPYVFSTTPQSIPAAPYLHVAADDVHAWKEKLAHLPRPWVGICWAGSQDHSHDMRRSLPLCPDSRFDHSRQAREGIIASVAERVAFALQLDALPAAASQDGQPSSWTLEPLLRRTAGSFISLQIGPHAGEIDELPADLRTRAIAPLANDADFYDTACLVRALDEVITVDTSVAHVTGALGQNGLLVKPAAPEWRWIGHDGRSAWYPTLKMLEQHAVQLYSGSSPRNVLGDQDPVDSLYSCH